MAVRWCGAALVAGLLAFGCTTEPQPAPSPRAQSFGSGDFRAAIEDFGFSAGLDPTSESSLLGLALQSELLVRTLVTYRHVAGRAGVVPVPDLAETTGDVSADGLTWTFTLKRDIQFGPPVSRLVTALDVEYAFRRMDTTAMAASYGYLYDGLIVGMNGPANQIPVDIPGISSPDSRTVIFSLTHPAGDFLHRLALPAAAPMPAEIADCFKGSGGYGRDLVSTGPYMIAGADQVSSRCGSLRPMAGFQPDRDLFLIRNPDYDPNSDNPAVRQAFPRTIDIRIDRNSDHIVNGVEQGNLDATLGVDSVHVPPGNHGSVLHWEPINGLEYLSMNVLTPPFDDVHVRRAVNLVLNRRAIDAQFLQAGHGLTTVGLFPPWLLGSPGSPPPLALEADLAAAKQEMSLSRYDANGDGICDADSCRRIYLIAPTTPPEVNVAYLLIQDLLQIGVVLKFFETDGPAPPSPLQGFVRYQVHIALNRARQPLYPDPAAIAQALDSGGITCEGQRNYSEVGMAEEQARECGVREQYLAVRDHIPNLDLRIATCEEASGAGRSACWASFDSYVMDQVVPWAPLRFPDTLILTGKSLAKYEYDQAFGTLSLCHIAVRPAGT